MRRAITSFLALTMLCACSAPDAPSIDFPPVGLAATARWLDTEGGLIDTARTGASQAIAAEQRLDRLQSAPTPVSQTVSVPPRTRPNTAAGRAAQAFGDICVASLPNMAGVAARMRLVNQRDFGAAPAERGGMLVGGEQPGDIYIAIGQDTGRNNANTCSVSVRRQNPSSTAQAMIDAVAAAGYRITPVDVVDAQRGWTISGAPAGTLLKMTSRRNALGQQLTGVWITWR